MLKTLAEYILHLKDAMPLDMCQRLIETYDSVSKSDPNYVKRESKIFDFAEINMLDHDAFTEFRKPMGELMRAVNNFYMDKTHNELKDRLVCYEPVSYTHLTLPTN